MKSDQLKYIGVGIGFLLLHLMLFRHLKIYNMQPDLVLIFILWFVSRSDRTSALLMAAGFGLAQDILLDMWGLNMFSKTLLIFISYNFIPTGLKKRLLLNQVFVSIFIAAVVHNLIFLGLNGLIDGYSGEIFFWRHLLGNSFYTAVIASFIQLFRT